MKLKLQFSLATVVSAFLVMPAFAETTSQREEQTDSVTPMDEIIVTANRRSERAQDVPVSITALAVDDLREMGIQSSTQLQSQVPNLVFNQSYAASNPQIFIRGVGVNDFNSNASTAVGIYVDEVYLSSPSALQFQLYDLERVEVLRGPQGTLYGRNTTGGAINFLTARPTREFSGFVSARYGRFDEFSFEGAISGLIADDAVMARLSGIYNRRDGTVRNRLTGKRVNNRDNWGLRGQLLVEPSDGYSLLLNVHAGRNTSQATQYQDRGIFQPVAPGVSPILAAIASGTTPNRCALADIRTFNCVDGIGYRDNDSGNPYSGEYNRVGNETLETYGLSGTINLDLGGPRLTAITAYEDVKLDRDDNTDGNPARLLEIRWRNQSWQFSQELRLASEGGQQFNWIVGGYYFTERTRSQNDYDTFRDLRPTLETALGAPGGFVPGFAFFAEQRYRQQVDALAAFAQVDYALADKLKLTLGLRYTNEKRRFTQTVDFVEPGFTISVVDYPGRATIAGDNGRRKVNRVTGSVTMDYRFADDVLGYATVARGFKSGGFNGGVVFRDAAVLSFRPETLTSYEVGLKSTWLDRKLRTNLSAFYYDYKNLQVFTLVNTGGVPTQIIDNAPKARVYGIEGDVAVVPVPDLTFTVGVGILNSRLVRYQAFTGFDPGGNATFANRAGNRLVGAPELTLNGSISYSLQLGDGLTLTPSMDARYQGSAFFDTANNPRLAQQNYSVINARITIGSEVSGWKIAAFGRNITNTRYLTAIFDLADFGFDQLTYGDRPTFGIEASIKF
ncbi:MAG: TonB-dependent receptor [Sphingomonadaceae bacterium]|nr:TonB-dependent receptor [Sphingomonadaceae bacterium]